MLHAVRKRHVDFSRLVKGLHRELEHVLRDDRMFTPGVRVYRHAGTMHQGLDEEAPTTGSGNGRAGCT